MDSWLAWAGFVIAVVLLAWVGYHFTVLTLRLVTAAFALAVVVLATRYGVTHPARGPTSLVNAFTRGAGELSAVFFHPLLPGRYIPPPARIGWLVIIAVLVFAYRELEVWAMRWQPPTVDMSALGGGKPGTQVSGAPGKGMTEEQRYDRVAAGLRFQLPAVEVRAPAILPGGTASGGLASIAENSGAATGGLAGAIIRFVGMLWPNPRQYQVRVWVEPRESSSHGEELATADTKVTVDLADLRTGRNFATKTLVAPDEDEAASVVAGYVARQVFKADPTAPAWGIGSFDGGDLAAVLLARQQRVIPKSEEDVDDARCARIKILEKEALNNRSAGVARYELAQLYDLEGYHVGALWLHALNRKQYPRFYRGRYRLGMSLEMIANPQFEPQKEKEQEEKEKEVNLLRQSLGILDECGLTGAAKGKRDDIVPGKELPDEVRKELLAAAQNELCACRQQLTLWHVIWATFRHRDERAIRMPHWRLRERQSFHDGALVAELLVTVRQRLAGEVCGRTRKEDRHVRKAMRITAAITGDSAAIDKFLNQDTSTSPEQAASDALFPPGKPKTSGEEWRPGADAERTRWLPWQHRTPSWQAAYNTACLYTALVGSCGLDKDKDKDKIEEIAERVVISLNRVVNDPDCEMRRPSYWISNDPDFSYLKSLSDPIPDNAFTSFLNTQEQRDYPTANPKPDQ